MSAKKETRTSLSFFNQEHCDEAVSPEVEASTRNLQRSIANSIAFCDELRARLAHSSSEADENQVAPSFGQSSS